MTQLGVAEWAAASPGEPPERVRSELLWRLAARLHRDHAHRSGVPECPTCGQRWPCSGRRLAELGLIRAIAAGSADEGGRHITEPEPGHAD